MSRNDLEHSLRVDQKVVNQGPTAASKLVPVIVVFGTISGFMALAWYAYQAGSQAVGDDELLIVEADKSPMKEKPTDPGGMQFPNQDKTIFDTFSGAKQPQAKVERVLPTPEEPLVRNTELSDTTTWINEKLHKHSAQADQKTGDGKPEQVIGGGDAEKGGKEPAVTSEPLLSVSPEEQTGRAKIIHIVENKVGKAEAEDVAKKEAAEKAAKIAAAQSAKEKAVLMAKEEADKQKTAKAAADKAAADKAAKEKVAKLAAAKTAAPKKSGGDYIVQLGAYRSNEEASGAWKQMQKKHRQLANMTPIIVRADLGDKGVYYRLRSGGFASANEAKAFCNSMSILGQACLVPAN